MFKLDLEKTEEPEIKLPTFIGKWKKQENSRKTSISASLTTLKPLTVWFTTNWGKFFKKWEYHNNPVYETAKETLMYRTVLWTLLERERVGRFGRMALKHV